ncbi:NADH-quinone oxidoreductase subunit N [Pseudonocardia acidicola]|uniref:NADH-quinone oxidoreductase subunit N n=1 Tax=Pseudonocardia acidicola TaxID=2724939 RepID=A0ABX1S7F6_9PSEU|nr:NADH-quinone oxidoreductase subunit N [Pseudonocardia acidicola]NMH97476.1 NADH-quinone oxidoreductase subunit N [Pseudonocardia acidicola]
MTGPATTAVQGVDLLAIAPPMLLAAAALVVLLVEAFRPAARLVATTALAGAGLALAAELVLAADVLGGGRSRATFCLPAALRGTGPASCSYVVDPFAVLLGLVALLAGAAALLLAVPEIRRTRLPAGEFCFLLLTAVAGAVALPAGRDLVTLVVCLELVSLPVFALVALRRYDGRSTESALTMFLVSVASTAVMLYGISLVYGLAGSMYLDRIAVALNPAAAPPAAAVGIVLVLVGFGFKVSAVPFHTWAPDTYAGAPVAVAAVLAVVSKVAGFAGLVLVLVLGFGGFAPVWAPLVAVLAAASMTVGNLVALRQRGALRLLAWSSIAQAGYVLAPLGALAGMAGRPELREELVAASVGYLVIYALMTTGAFAVVAFIGRITPGNDGTDLDGYRGLARTHPVVGVAFAFFLACLAGLPPGLAGLFAKVVVVRAVVDGGHGWLAVIVAVNTVIGLYYYLAWAVRLFAPPAADGAAFGALRRPIAVAIAVAVAGLVLLSVFPEPVLAGWSLTGTG